MPLRFTVLLRALDSSAEARLRAILGDTCGTGDSGTGRILCLLGEGWLEQLDTGLPDGARLLWVADPDDESISQALADGRIHGAISSALPAKALQVAMERSYRQYELRRSLHEQVARGDEYLDAIALLSRLGSGLSDRDSRGTALRGIAETACQASHASVAALILVDKQESPLLHVHAEVAISDSDLLSIRNRCVDAYFHITGRGLKEEQLVPQYSGVPLRSDDQGDSVAPSMGPSLELPLVYGAAPLGVLLVAGKPGVILDRGRQRILELTAARTADVMTRMRTRRFEQRQHLGLMVESMADGLIMTELERDEVLINPAARRLLDIDADTEVTQKYLKERLNFYPFDLVAANPDSSELLREELRIGDNRVHSMVSPVRERNGSLVGVVVVLRDFTEAHDLAHRQQEFVAIVSHELRSPLTSISGALDIALSDYAGRLNDKQREYLELARRSCTALNHIVDDLLDVARSESGGMPIHMAAIDLNQQTELAVEQYRAPALAKHIDMQFKSSGGELCIAGDADRLTQVLNNLLSNALKFTPIKGRIEVEVFGPSVTSSHVGVSVYNNGDAIAEISRERIFEKFEQIKDSSTRRVGGSGLGLAISRSIIEAHGGRIWVESGERGAKFIFTLPSIVGDVSDAAPIAEIESSLLSAPRSGHRVLLIDADQHSSYILKGILMSAGHDVVVAGDPDAALMEARKRLPPLIVVSASSLADPVALIEILKHDTDTRRSAILALVAPANQKPDLAATAGTVLAVPVEPDPFLKECNRLILEAGSAQTSRVLIVDDDSAIRTICAEVLRQAGMTVREAANGLAALTESKRFRPDLILLDIMMPDLDGFETAEHLKADPATAMTPIIFLSAMGETADKVRAFRIGAEDYVVKPFVAAELVARTRKALVRSNRELGASPTTQLPGGGAIEAEIEARLEDPEAAFCYLDLDNLKAYNDYYSYAKADSIIRQTGDLIRDIVARLGSPKDFIGHIAGDDFVFITTRAAVDSVCSTLCTAFDRLMPLYYDKQDREAGFIEAKDRYGEVRRFPLMSVSIAAITNGSSDLRSYSELASAAAVGKKLAKDIPGSCYIRDGQSMHQALA